MKPRLSNTRLGVAAAALALTTLAAACTQPAPEPTPVPSPAPTPTPPPVVQAPPQLPTPTYDNWLDAPQTPGTWFYTAEATETLATFGDSRTAPMLVLRCDLATRRVGLGRTATASGQVSMRIRTETADRTVTGTALTSRNLIIHEFAANDNFLDALAFSRGRFALETGGLPTLYPPVYPEITRVIEDCR